VLTCLGSLDPADYRQPVMTLLFLKRLNDTFEEDAKLLPNLDKDRYQNGPGRIQNRIFHFACNFE
jgi:type I restriction-modification system DNA methylase subunit